MITLNQLFELLDNHAEESTIRSASYTLVEQGTCKYDVIDALVQFDNSHELSEEYEDSLFNVMSDIEKYC